MSTTYVTKFVSEKVCPYAKGYTGFITLPIITASTFLTPVPWFLVGILTVLFIYVVPCNPNLNCTSITKKKDGQKAFVVSLIIVYLILFATALLAKLFICESNADTSVQKNKGILTNAESLVNMLEMKNTYKV